MRKRGGGGEKRNDAILGKVPEGPRLFSRCRLTGREMSITGTNKSNAYTESFFSSKVSQSYPFYLSRESRVSGNTPGVSRP